MVTASKSLELLSIIELNKCEAEKMGHFLAHMMVPALVLRAFSCELVLKSLVADNQKDPENTHKLNDLYHKADVYTKDAITTAVVCKMQEYHAAYGMIDFFSDLDNMTNIFIDWRHIVNYPSSLDNFF